MKGYMVLAVFMACVHVVIPVVLLDSTPAQVTIPAQTTAIAVQHTASEETSTMELAELAFFETIGMLPDDAPEEAVKAVMTANYTQFCYQSMTNEQGCVISTAMAFPECYNESYWREQWGDNYAVQMTRFRDVCSLVSGKRILYDEQPILAVMHRLNTGNTEDATVLFGTEIPYLKSVASPSDAASTDLISTVNVPIDQAREILSSEIGATLDEKTDMWFSNIQKTDQKTVISLKIGSIDVTGAAVQQAFSLPSAAFDVSVQNDQVVFTVYGNGHFVGMSITGVCAMANDGQTYEQILAHYYPNTKIQ